MSDIVTQLNDAAESKSGASIRNGCVECGLSSVTCSNAADEIERLRAERDAALAERDAARQHIDRAWFGIEHGFDIEPREFFEKDAPRNGFKWPLEQAVHHIWKRDAKVASLQSALTEARRVLRLVEWRGHTETRRCPSCGGGYFGTDHTPDCALAAVLAQEEK